MTTFVFTIALITINELLQFVPLNALWGLTIFYVLLQLTTFACTITIDNFCMHYYYRQLLYGLLQQRTITYFRTTLTSSVTLITTTYKNL